MTVCATSSSRLTGGGRGGGWLTTQHHRATARCGASDRVYGAQGGREGGLRRHRRAVAQLAEPECMGREPNALGSRALAPSAPGCQTDVSGPPRAAHRSTTALGQDRVLNLPDRGLASPAPPSSLPAPSASSQAPPTPILGNALRLLRKPNLVPQLRLKSRDLTTESARSPKRSSQGHPGGATRARAKRVSPAPRL